MFSFEYCEIFKNTYFEEHLRTSGGPGEHLEVFCKNGVLRTFAKFTGKHLRQNVFFNKVAGFIKKETLAQVFSCEFCEISENSFSYRTPPMAAFLQVATIFP